MGEYTTVNTNHQTFMLKNLLSLFLFFNLLVSFPAQAQMVGKMKDLVEFSKRPLIVTLLEAGDEKDSQGVFAFNEAVKSSIESCWALNQKVTFMTESEIESLIKAKNKGYAVLQIESWQITKERSRHGTYYANPNSWVNSFIRFRFIEDSPMSAFYLHYLLSPHPNQADLTGALMQTQNFIEKSIRNKRELDLKKEAEHIGPTLTKKTLLIDKGMLYKTLTEDEIKEIYTSPYKLVDRQEIEDAILNREPGYAYIDIQPANPNNPTQFNQFIVDAHSGDILAYSPPLRFFKLGGYTFGRELEKVNFEDFNKYIIK